MDIHGGPKKMCHSLPYHRLNFVGTVVQFDTDLIYLLNRPPINVWNNVLSILFGFGVRFEKNILGWEPCSGWGGVGGSGVQS